MSEIGPEDWRQRLLYLTELVAASKRNHRPAGAAFVPPIVMPA